MTDRSGILPNSPLLYTVASIRFAPWSLVGKKIEEIQELLREKLPLFHKVQMQRQGPEFIAGAANESMITQSWVLVTSDRNFSVHITSDQLLFVSKNYLKYSDFAEFLDFVLGIFISSMRFMDVTNMGIRYIDLIKLRAGEKPRDYISEKLLPPSLDGFFPEGGVTLSNYKTKDCYLRVRCITEPQAIKTPEDIIPALAVIDPSKPFVVENLGHDAFLLDMDAVKIFSEPARMSTEQIKKELSDLHVVANNFFRHKEVCTDHAFLVWKTKE